jgi:hypothetical protein
MKRELLIFSLLLLSTVGYAKIVSWDASSGLLPSDESIPIEERFLSSGSYSFSSLQDGALNINDIHDYLHDSYINGTTLPTNNEDWAYQIELRVNSHSGSSFDYAAETGFRIDGTAIFTTISSEKVGFGGAGDFLNGQSYTMDTTDDFHIYRVIKTSETVSLYVDVFNTPVLVIPYDEFPVYPAHETSMVYMVGSPSSGLANFDVKSYVYNTSGTTIPEPATISLLTIGAFLAGRRRK